MLYHRLSVTANEIRCITILPSEQQDGSDNCPQCLLEHVSLGGNASALNSNKNKNYLYKGKDRTWPEASSTWDVKALYRDPKHPQTTTQLRDQVEAFIPSSKDQDIEDNLPWRYIWGDYIALSYAWNDKKSTRTIFVNGSPFQVTENLYDALVQLGKCSRVRQGFKLWIDAICINQKDLAERTQQVGRMREIYASAWQIVVWLGREANDSNLALTALYWMASWSKLADPLEEFYERIKLST